jgi:hypothetical protein
MQVCGVLLSVLLCVGVLFGESLQGIQISDIDSKADPVRTFMSTRMAHGAPTTRFQRRWTVGADVGKRARRIKRS